MLIPIPLLEDIAAGKCLPFVGAGFSLNAKLPDDEKMPDWPGLTKILASAAGIPEKAGGPEVASEYERQFGRVQLIETIRYALHSDIVEPGKAHKAFAQLPFDTIYTTNFDLLLEDANSLVRRPYRSLVGELQMPFHGGPLTTNIVKMHGDLRHEEHMIVTKEDYSEFLRNYPVVSTHLSAMLITRTALFMGYSLSDPDFRHVREVVRDRLGRFLRMAYIIQFNQSESKVRAMLDDHLHVINLKTKRGDSVDQKLAELFDSIQEELDIRAGKRLRATKPEIFEEMPMDTFDAMSRSPDSSTLLASSSNLCFVLMPFGDPFDSIYRDLIQPVVTESGLQSMRADQLYYPGTIIEQVRAGIQQSRICIADLTGRNPNVLYELGIAQTLGKPTVLIAQDIEDIPLHVKHFRIIAYGTGMSKGEAARTQLTKTIEAVLGQDRLDEASRLIDNGMFRAGVAMLGALLEHSLRHLIMKYNLADAKTCERKPGVLSMGRMLEMLVRAQVITEDEYRRLREATSIRNRAVHELAEPSAEEAQVLLFAVQEFIRNYIDTAEQEVQRTANP